MTSEAARPSDALYSYFRRMSRELDRMGDSVGPNDMELSNLLWYASGKMRNYADRFKEDTNA